MSYLGDFRCHVWGISDVMSGGFQMSCLGEPASFWNWQKADLDNRSKGLKISMTLQILGHLHQGRPGQGKVPLTICTCSDKSHSMNKIWLSQNENLQFVKSLSCSSNFLCISFLIGQFFSSSDWSDLSFPIGHFLFISF